MKILQVNDYGIRFGGAEQYFFSISEGLKARGHEVVTVTSDHQRGGLALESDFQLPESGNFFNIDSVFNPRAAWQLRDILRRIKPDIIHYHNTGYRLSPSVFFVSGNIPSVVTLHDYLPICFSSKTLPNYKICESAFSCCKGPCGSNFARPVAALQKQLLRRSLKGIGMLIAPSQYLEREYRKNAFYNIRHLRHPTSWGQGIITAQKEKRDFLYCGRLARVKGISFLIQAFSQLVTDQRLLIVGEGPERPALEELARTSPAAERIVFYGYRGKDERNALMAGALMHVLPSVWPEVSGLSVSEAAVQGTASIVSAVGGVQELVVDGLSGLVVPHASTDALIAALKFALENPEKAIQFGLEAQKRALAYGLDNHIADLEEIYQQQLSSRKSGAGTQGS